MVLIEEVTSRKLACDSSIMVLETVPNLLMTTSIFSIFRDGETMLSTSGKHLWGKWEFKPIRIDYYEK